MSFLEDIFKGGVEGVLGGVKNLINVWKTDSTTLTANEQEKARWANQIALMQIEVTRAELNAEIMLAQAQTEINKVEAASSDWFVRRARPAAMWVCVCGFAYQNLAYPMLVWLSLNQGWQPPPVIPTAAMESMLFALLGIGAYRSYDKLKGTSK